MQIFIIDDPETIGPSRAKMKEAFDALAHLAEKEDTDGIQLRFTNTGINEQTAVQDRASPLESADEAGFRGQTLDRSDTRQPPNLEDDLSKAM